MAESLPEIDDLNEYYFTFGQVHETIDGEPMKDYWVRVLAGNYGLAREKFCSEFAEPIMGDPAKWSFQYKAAEFNNQYRRHFSKGEYRIIQ